MEDSLITALTITVIGMSLLFLSLIFFYGLLALLATAIRDSPPVAAHSTQGGEGRDDGVLRAAAVAIALARTETEGKGVPFSVSVGDQAAADQQVSPWWALHHQRQLAHHPSARRGR